VRRTGERPDGIGEWEKKLDGRKKKKDSTKKKGREEISTNGRGRNWRRGRWTTVSIETEVSSKDFDAAQGDLL